MKKKHGHKLRMKIPASNISEGFLRIASKNHSQNEIMKHGIDIFQNYFAKDQLELIWI